VRRKYRLIPKSEVMKMKTPDLRRGFTPGSGTGGSAGSIAGQGSIGANDRAAPSSRAPRSGSGTGGTAGIDPTSMDAMKHGDCGPASYSGN
jgi:hypothetical protein